MTKTVEFCFNRLYDANTNSVIARYEIHRILFYARGAVDSPEASCFAFTWSHGETQESAIFQCHVFRCDIAEAVTRVSGNFPLFIYLFCNERCFYAACFAKAFQRVPKSMTSSVTSAIDMTGSITTLSEARTLMYVFEVSLEIKEDEGKVQRNYLWCVFFFCLSFNKLLIGHIFNGGERS